MHVHARTTTVRTESHCVNPRTIRLRKAPELGRLTKLYEYWHWWVWYYTKYWGRVHQAVNTCNTFRESAIIKLIVEPGNSIPSYLSIPLSQHNKNKWITWRRKYHWLAPTVQFKLSYQWKWLMLVQNNWRNMASFPSNLKVKMCRILKWHCSQLQ